MQWLSASCHILVELHHAQNIGVDFVVLAPVMPTATHPGSATLGWEKFEELVAQINMPVYALGCMTVEDLTAACQAGRALRGFERLLRANEILN
jgi:8-oxo-dGTP diphosphatase